MPQFERPSHMFFTERKRYREKQSEESGVQHWCPIRAQEEINGVIKKR
jgi:hypothetical protein